MSGMTLKFFKDRKDWTQKAMVDQGTGEHRQEYYFKRKKAPRIPIDTPLARKLAGYSLIEKDLRTVIGWLEKLEELLERRHIEIKPGYQLIDNHEDDLVAKSLYLSSLTFYGKCFSECKGRKVKLERSNISEEFHDAHDEVISMRNNYGAHSGKEKYEKVNVVLVLNPKKKYRHESPFLVRESFQPESIHSLPDENDSFLHLVDHVREYTLAKIEKLNSLVFEKDINPKGKEYWYELGKRS